MLELTHDCQSYNKTNDVFKYWAFKRFSHPASNIVNNFRVFSIEYQVNRCVSNIVERI